jgi:hypothetical protein
MAMLQITRASATELSANHWNASFDNVDLGGGAMLLTTDLGNGQPFTAIGFSEDADGEMCALHYVQTASPLTLVLATAEGLAAIAHRKLFPDLTCAHHGDPSKLAALETALRR